MTNQPKLSDAEAADQAQDIENRPAWFNVESVTGLVSEIKDVTQATKNGSIHKYLIVIPQPKNLKAGTPVDGAVELEVVEPFATGRNLSQQPYHWTVKAARAIDPSVNDLSGLVGKEWTFSLSTRQRFAGETKPPTMFYDVKPVAGTSVAGNGSTPAYTKEELYAVYESAQGMLFQDAVAQFTMPKIERLLLGTLSAGGEKLEFGLVQNKETHVLEAAASA